MAFSQRDGDILLHVVDSFFSVVVCASQNNKLQLFRIKLKLARGLEKCLARVNSTLIKHKIIIALDDRGNISCHKM